MRRLAIFLAVLAGCSSAPPLEQDPEAPKLLGERYHATGFSIAPPKSFKRAESPPGMPLSPGANGAPFMDPAAFTTMLVVSFHQGDADDVDGFIARLADRAKESHGLISMTVVSSEKVSVAGHEACLVTSDMTLLGVDMRGLELLVPTKKGICVAQGNCARDLFEQNRRLFRASLASVTLDD